MLEFLITGEDTHRQQSVGETVSQLNVIFDLTQVKGAHINALVLRDGAYQGYP